MTEARRLYPDWDVTRSWSMPFIPVAAEDESLESYLRRSGFTDVQLAYVQRGFAGAAAEAVRHLSAAASVEQMQDTRAGVDDWRILDGYDALLDHLARGLDVRLNTVAASVEWSAHQVSITTTDGQVYSADRAVITLPIGVLQARRVAFAPALPADKQTAIDGILAAPVLKLVYRFDRRVLPDGIMALYSDQNPCMWWSPSFGHDDSMPGQVVTAFVTADRARALLALASDDAMLDAALAVLRAELDQPTLTPVAARVVNWVDDPFALCGYSASAVGRSHLHDALALPVADTLFWAGEATAGRVWNATVHGAYVSGRRAAADICSRIGSTAPST